MSGGYAYLLLALVGVLPNEIWRLVGLWASRSVDEGTELMRWVRAVAAAILAGVIAQILIHPPGALAEASLLLRLSSIAIGAAVFWLARRSILVGVVAAEVALIVGLWLRL